MSAVVVAVHRRSTHSFSKDTVASIEVTAGYGYKGMRMEAQRSSIAPESPRIPGNQTCARFICCRQSYWTIFAGWDSESNLVNLARTSRREALTCSASQAVR